MKTRITKLAAFVLAMLLCISVFAACGGPEDSGETPAFDVEQSISLKEGATYQIEPKNVVAIDSFAYLSDDSSVATVSDSGLVTAVAAGSTEIIVSGGGVNKEIAVTVTENTVAGYPVKKLDAIAPFTDTIIDGLEPVKWNFGWDNPTTEGLTGKIDFAGTAADSDVVMRVQSSEEKFSLVENGGFTPVLIAGTNTAMTEETTPEGAHVSLYAKAQVSQTSYALQMWVCSWKDAVVSGMGKFRVVALEKDAANNTYKEYVLTARDSGDLTQDAEGWIAFNDVDAQNNPIGSPENALFEFNTKSQNYDIAGKEVVLSIEFAAIANTLGENGANMQCRLGVKRLGFVEEGIAAPDSYTLGKTMTAEIDYTLSGDLDEADTKFSSADVNVATVSADGVITAVAKGETVITVENGGNSAEVSVTVLDNYFTVASDLSVAVGQTKSFGFENEIGDAAYVYDVEDEAVVSAADGAVRGLKEGSTSITITKGDCSAVVKVTVTLEVDQIYDIENSKLQALSAFTADEVDIDKTGAQGINFVPSWGGTATFSADDSAENAVKTMRGIAGVNNREENWVDMICPDNDTQAAAVYTKLTVPSDKGNFRIWAYAPQAGGNLSGKGKARVMFYVPNEDYTSYLPVGLGNFNFAEQPNWNATVDADGYLTFENGVDGFFAFTVPESIKGKTVIMVIESVRVSSDNGVQDRFAFKRLGFTA